MKDRDTHPAALPAGEEETSIRQLIANGKYKTALDRAKEFHKAQHSSASEALLIDAYASRIQSLLAQNLTIEAKSLVDLVRERYPSARARLDSLRDAATARSGALDDLLAPLADASLDPQRKATIELAVQNNVADLPALASSPALAPDHALRIAAQAVERALAAVTSGPVTDEQLALPEISRRSPLAPWTLLVRAIAYFYRGEDERCKEMLQAIKPESVAARLIPAMHAMLGARDAAALTPAAAVLASRTVLTPTALRKNLEDLEAAFDDDESETRIFKLVRSALQECRRSAPGQVAALKKMLYVRGSRTGVDVDRMEAALEGMPRLDAALLRALARDMEAGNDPDSLAIACETWDRFKQSAIEEGWFPAKGAETAVLYLHMAGLVGKIPRRILWDLQGARRRDGKKGPEELYFLYPERLYGRACALDPHREAFAQWHTWAVGLSVSEAEAVAKAWHKVIPADIEPLLYLMREASKRSAFPTALGFLDKAERIDAVHSEVRAARLRLLVGSTLRHLQQKKPHLAAEKLTAMAALPQSKQGDRPAFIEAVTYIVILNTTGTPGIEESRAELERLLGSDIAAGMLVWSLAAAARYGVSIKLPLASSLSKAAKQHLPSYVARLSELARDLAILKFRISPGYLREASRSFPDVRDTLNVSQLTALAETAIAEGEFAFAYVASGAGLAREGPTPGPAAARFLFLRAQSFPEQAYDRRSVCAAAAVELARQHREIDVLEAALEFLKEDGDVDPLSLTIEQAREVLRKEASNTNPDYSGLLPDRLCNCPKCRRARRGMPDPFDEDDALDDETMRRGFYEKVPKGMPKEAAEELFDLMRKAFLNGVNPDEIFEGIGKAKKGKRK